MFKQPTWLLCSALSVAFTVGCAFSSEASEAIPLEPSVLAPGSAGAPPIAEMDNVLPPHDVTRFTPAERLVAEEELQGPSLEACDHDPNPGPKVEGITIAASR